jgi:hypothetical protein
MPAATFLSSVVEIAIGIAGFAGIIAAIQHRGVSHWPARQLILLQILFFASAMAIVFALLPAALQSAGVPEGKIWRIGSGGLLAWYLGVVPYRLRQSRKLSVRLPLPPLLIVWAVLASSLQIYNLTTPGLAWPYLFGVFSLVINSFSVFLLLLFKSDWGDEKST